MSRKSRGEGKKDRRRTRRGQFPVRHPIRPVGSDRVYYYKDGFLSMSQEVAKRVYVAKKKATIKGVDFFYSIVAVSFVAVPGMATMFITEREALTALEQLEVGISAQLEVVNLFEYLASRMQTKEDVVQEEESFEELGIETPEIDTSELGDEEEG